LHTLRILSKQEVKKLHSASLEVLNTVGLKIDSEKARKILEEAGAEVNHQTMLVHFPPHLVEESVKKAPQKVIFAARNPKYDAVLEPGGDTFCRPTVGSEGYVDLETGKYRHVQLSDAKEWATLVDGLENISYCAVPYPADPPLDEGGDAHVLRIVLENTEKHIHAYCGRNPLKYMKYMIELAVAVMGSEEELKKRPIFNTMLGALSPLEYEDYMTDLLLLSGEYGIPAEIATMPIAGGTAPVTVAGTILLSHVELLAGITIAEIANPGAPIVYRPIPMTLDMSTGAALEATAENALMAAAGAQLVRETYNIPTNLLGQVADAFIPDGESMIERSFNTLLPTLAGANVVSGAGGLEHVYTMDPVQLVIDDEIVGMTKRILRGLEINNDTLGLDALARVGPGGNFLSDDHTLKYFRTEYYRPHICNRGTREIWQSKGEKDLNENARQRAKTILREHKPAPLPDDVVKELDSIIKRLG